MPTYSSLTHSSLSVSLATHHHPLIFQWRVTPILPEDPFGIFPRQFHPIKPYFHQTKDVILTSNAVRLYMQIISLNIAWSKRYSYWNFPWVLPRRCRNSTSFLSGPSSSMRMNIFSSHTTLKLNSLLDSTSSYELRNNIIKQDYSRLGRVICLCRYQQTSRVYIT